jgi:hypothetical protein
VTFTHLNAEDITTRILGGMPMVMRVLRVSADRIYCVPEEARVEVAVAQGLVWEFDPITGGEIDDDLRWGHAYGITGSYLVLQDGSNPYCKEG